MHYLLRFGDLCRRVSSDDDYIHAHLDHRPSRYDNHFFIDLHYVFGDLDYLYYDDRRRCDHHAPEDHDYDDSASGRHHDDLKHYLDDDAPVAVDAAVLGEAVSPSESDPESLASTIEASGVLPATGMLARYVPANLPGGLTRPVVGFLAIIEMIIGAFVASLRQLGGPLTAAAIFVGFSGVAASAVQADGVGGHSSDFLGLKAELASITSCGGVAPRRLPACIRSRPGWNESTRSKRNW